MEHRNKLIFHLFDSKERPFDHTWQYWTTKWWLWFLSIPKSNNPATDTTGNRSSNKQSDSRVWFLTSTTGFRAERIVKAPSGKAILFPIINVTISNAEEPTLNTDRAMISFVRGHMDDIVEKRASIDGKDLHISENFRVQSPPFHFSYPPNNVFGARTGPTRGVGDGYWIFLKPLQPGTLEIETYGSCMSGKIQISTKMKLIIKRS